MKKVGQLLKEARDRKNLSLEEAEKATRIRKKILTFLEDSNWEKLPSPTFIKGLLKNYGEYLDLDTNNLLAFFRREYEEPKVQKNVPPVKVKKPRIRFTPQVITLLAFVAIFLSGGLYLFSQYRSFTAAPLLEVSEPANNVKNETLDINFVGKTYPDAILKINGQTIQLSPGGTFSVAVSLVEGINTIIVTAENRFGQISTDKRTVVVEDKESTEKDQNQDSDVSLTLNIGPGAANVRIEADGKNIFEGVLVTGSSKNFSADERIKVFTSNAGSTKIIFDGKEEVLGKEGESLEREFKES